MSLEGVLDQTRVLAIGKRGKKRPLFCNNEVLIQSNRIERRVITREALPLPLQLGPDILWFKFLVTRPRSSCFSCARTIIVISKKTAQFVYILKKRQKVINMGIT
jgi:hypothetical protein